MLKGWGVSKKARYSGFNCCPSKNSTYALRGDNQFSTRAVTKNFMIGITITCMECAHFFAAVREAFTDFPRVGSLMPALTDNFPELFYSGKHLKGHFGFYEKFLEH